MSESQQQQETKNESSAQWPENGCKWNDSDMEQKVDFTFLQVMVEDDEEIDAYNAETFGMDLVGQETTEPKPPPPPPPQAPPQAPRPQALPRAPPQAPPPVPKPLSRAVPPPRQRPQFSPWAPLGSIGSRGRGQRGGLSQCRIFEDSAVLNTVKENPGLMSLDSAIVDCGSTMHLNTSSDDFMVVPSPRKRRTSGSILEDSAVVCVIGRGARQMTNNSLNVPYPTPPFIPPFRGIRGEPPRSYPRKYFGQRGAPQMNPFMPPMSTINPCQVLNPRQAFNQTGSLRFPRSQPWPSSPQPQSPKVTQLCFGADSPRPPHIHTISSHLMPSFRSPGPLTQLHPEHKRLLTQKLRLFQRKPQGSDPYSNLMTAKDKEWIIKLQMIQLQTENPYVEDYYYQEYYRRMEEKMAKEELGLRAKKGLPKLTTPYIMKTESYAPVVHIEGSLGQVAVSTCYSPRRAISAVHAAQAQGLLEEQKDMRQERLEILGKTEKLFLILLEVEELDRIKNTYRSEEDDRRTMEKKHRKVEYIYAQLQEYCPLDSGAQFLPFLLISKGKCLVARLLPFLKDHEALKILSAVTSNLPMLMSRDVEETLPVLYSPLRNVIGSLAFSQLIQVLKNLMLESPSCKSLALACENKFGLSLLYALLSHGEKLLSSGIPLEPSIGDFEIWTEMIFQVASQLSSSSLVEPLLMPSNLLTLFCRYLDKRTVHQLKSNMESATPFLALPS